MFDDDDKPLWYVVVALSYPARRALVWSFLFFRIANTFGFSPTHVNRSKSNGGLVLEQKAMRTRSSEAFRRVVVLGDYFFFERKPAFSLSACCVIYFIILLNVGSLPVTCSPDLTFNHVLLLHLRLLFAETFFRCYILLIVESVTCFGAALLFIFFLVNTTACLSFLLVPRVLNAICFSRLVC